MKLYLSNLGRIKEAEIEPRGFTVFVGPNNTNKTWAAYAFYGIATQLTHDPRLLKVPGFSSGDFKLTLPEDIKQKIQSSAIDSIGLLSGSNVKIKAVHIPRQTIISPDNWPEGIRVTITHRELSEILALYDPALEDAKVSLGLESAELAGRIPIDDVLIFQTEDSIRAGLSRKGATYLEVEMRRSNAADETLKLYVQTLLQRMAIGVFSTAYVFPSERKMISILVSNDEWNFHPDRNYSLSIRDYTDFLHHSRRPWESSDLGAINARNNCRYLEQMLGGEIRIDENRKIQTLRYVVGDNLDLPVHAASSLVRALSGLDIYLREGFAKPNSLLVIDEPEMNAHPDAQLAICELLAVLVNQGVQVLVTTHSPYFVDHLNNLIEASLLGDGIQDTFAGKFKLKTKDAFISPDKVAVYDFSEIVPGGEEVVVKDIFDRENRIIDWSTFGKVSDYTSNLYSEIIAKTIAEDSVHVAD